jgi:hypothetical protein
MANATIYLNDAVLAAIDIAASDNDRSRSYWINELCARELRALSYLPPDEARITEARERAGGKS